MAFPKMFKTAQVPFFADLQNLLWTGRGTTALWLILKAHAPTRRGVLVPVNVCEVVVAAIYHAGLVPVFHDVDPVSGNAELEHIQKAYTPEVGVWIAVHNYGTPVDLRTMLPWARNRQVYIIEDVCNALGATDHGRPVGRVGDAAIFSFGYAKIAEVGQGGALSLQTPELMEKARNILFGLPSVSAFHRKTDAAFQSVLRSLRSHPTVQKPSVYRAIYREYMPHMLFKPDRALVESILEKLIMLPENIQLRRAKATRYRKLLDLPEIQHRPQVDGDVYWRYCFLVPDNIRDKLIRLLREKNIPASSWFPPVHMLFKEAADNDQYPGATAFSRQVVNLWVNDQVNNLDIDLSVNLIKQILKEEKI